MEMKEKIYSVRRDLILLLLGIFLSFTTQIAYDSIREFPAFQTIPLILRTNILAVIFGLATFALLIYFFHNESDYQRKKKHAQTENSQNGETSDEVEIGEEEEKRRDKMIYDIILGRYKQEARRGSDLDSKANNVTGIAGVLGALIAAIAGYLPQSRYPLLFIIPLVFLVISAIFGILASWIKTYWAIKPQAIIDEYKDQHEDKILREYTATVSKNTMKNHEVNDQKANRIQFALVFLVVAITLFFVVAIINWL